MGRSVAGLAAIRGASVTEFWLLSQLTPSPAASLLPSWQETERLRRLKQAAAREAQRSRSAAASYAQRQRAAAAHEQRHAAAAAAAAAAHPKPLNVSTTIDYRFTRLHEVGCAAAPAAAGGPAKARSGGGSGPFSIVRYEDYLERLEAQR